MDEEQEVIVGYDPEQKRYVFLFSSVITFHEGQAFSLPKEAIENAENIPVDLDGEFLDPDSSLH